MKKTVSTYGILWLTVLILVFTTMIPVSLVRAETPTFTHKAAASMLIDAETGQILYQHNMQEPLGIASMSKMMTEYLLLEAIDQGTVKWEDTYDVTPYTYKVSQDRRLSNVPLREDGTYTVRELYEAMAIYSANAATIAIAEILADTETAFIQMMNDKASELGLQDYKFVNSTGLENSFLFGLHPEGTSVDEENVMPALSVAKLAYRLMNDYPEVLETAQINEKIFREGTPDAIKMSNWNFMLPGLIYEYEGVDGLKTGTTDFAGQCFTGTAKRGDQRFIVVVMNAVDEKGESTYKARFDAAKELLDYGFNEFSQPATVIKKGQTFEGWSEVPVVAGKSKTVAIEAADDFQLYLPKGKEKEYVPTSLVGEVESLVAPVKAGERVGYATVEHQKTHEVFDFLYNEQQGASLVTVDAVKEQGWLSRTLAKTGIFFTDLWKQVTGK